MSDDPVKECEVCGEPVRRLLFPVAIQFKGNGFYTTDYARRNTLSSAGNHSANGGESDTSSERSTSSEKAGSSDGDTSGASGASKPVTASAGTKSD
jgi:predicted nucleic acid-binding Zn ribbon protein